ncbi:MAG: GNAT family N-acetyltransferase [Rhodocyclales bacterium]|nr:GNAT family N-acetyltransferase [Rhodocyclales bacterium]
METEQRRWLASLPLWSQWHRLLKPNTLFVGSTVTEYAPMPAQPAPRLLVAELLRAAQGFPFLIIKDIPGEAVLVGDAAMDYNRELLAACRQAGFMLVAGQALAYVPIDFDSTASFLARMSHSRRKGIKRKLKSRDDLTVETVPTGNFLFDDEALLAELYRLYRNVYDQSEIHFDLLSADFFRSVLQDPSSGGVVFLYRAAGALIGYNLCFESNGMLIDKYVGFAYPQARQFNLYVVSWFHNLDYALAKGLTCYVAGWTDPEIKRKLGAQFTFTQHAVYVRNPLLRTLLRPLKRYFEADSRWHLQAR